MDEKPSYYAIIPANVRYAKINPSAKLLYGEITALANVKGYCYASNDYFADLYDLKRKQTVSDWIRSLEDLGVITVERFRDEKKIKKRKIYLTNNQQRKNVVEPTTKNSCTVQRKNVKGYNEKTLREYYKSNTTSNNNYNNNTSSENSILKNPYTAFESQICKLNAYQRVEFLDWQKEFGNDVLLFAIKHICTTDLRTTWGTFNWLMKTWHDHNLKSLSDVKDYEKQNYEANKAKRSYKSSKPKKKVESYGQGEYAVEKAKADRGEFPF